MTGAGSLEDAIGRAGGPAALLRSVHAARYPMPIKAEYTTWQDEQRAWSTTAVLFDQSHHMTDLYLRGGGDLRRLLSDVGVIDPTSFAAGRAKQFVACAEDGHLVGDAILFGFSEDEFVLVGSPTLPEWVRFRAAVGNYDVEVVVDERTVVNPTGRRVFRFQLQGPSALSIAQKAAGRPFDDVKFFQMGELEVAGVPMRFLSHAMSGGKGKGSTGLELIGPFEQRQAVLDALVAAGEQFGLRLGGSLAYPTAALESGWIGLHVPAIYSGAAMGPYREFLPADSYAGSVSLGGSFQSPNIEDYYFTPWDLGYHRLINYDHEFTGRAALLALADQPHRRKVWLRWNDEDVAAAMASSLFGAEGARAKYLALPQSVYATYQYDSVLKDAHPVGVSNRVGYTSNVGGWSSNTVIDEAVARDGEEVVVLWGEPENALPRANVEPHSQVEIRATVSTHRLA